MLLAITSITLLGAFFSLIFDLILLAKFFPIAYTNYDMFMFDHSNLVGRSDFYASYLDIMAHFGIANMLNHSLLFLFLTYIWKSNFSRHSFFILSLFFIFPIGSKMLFFIKVFGQQDFFYLPTLSLIFCFIGLGLKMLLTTIRRSADMNPH